jgi:beta-lactamase regulating signal transducer with metallopeptidase domain
MMHMFNAVMLAVGSSSAASIIAKATLAAASGLAGAWLARGSRAAVRHAVLAAAFGVLLLLPIVSTVTPPFRIVVQETSAATFVPTGARATVVPGVMRKAPRPERSLSVLLLWGWIAGTAIFLAPVAMGLWHVRSLRGSAQPWQRGQSLVDGLAPDAGIRRRVKVLLHGSLVGPMTCGVVHPAVVFSADTEKWAEEDLTRAIVHELEHVRRGDRIVHCLARAIRAAYWFHPLVWLVWSRLELEAERACDDAVLTRSEATAYADQLVELARRLTRAKTPLLAMANRADLAARVTAVLDTRQRRGRAGRCPGHSPAWLRRSSSPYRPSRRWRHRKEPRRVPAHTWYGSSPLPLWLQKT